MLLACFGEKGFEVIDDDAVEDRLLWTMLGVAGRVALWVEADHTSRLASAVPTEIPCGVG